MYGWARLPLRLIQTAVSHLTGNKNQHHNLYWSLSFCFCQLFNSSHSYKTDSDCWHGRQPFFSWSSTITNEYIKTVFKYLYWEWECSNGYKLYLCLRLCSIMWGALACVAYTWLSTDTKSTFGLESEILGHNPGFHIYMRNRWGEYRFSLDFLT